MKYFLIIFGIVAFLGCSRQENIQERYTKNIHELSKVCGDIQDSPEAYKELCDCYESNDYVFLDSSVTKYVLYQNTATDYTENYQEVNSGSDPTILNGFRTLLSDSSNFKWGEAGTPWLMYEIDFIDSLNQVIAQITVGSGGMLWTTPHFGITKWGSISIKGYNEAFDLVELIANE